MIASIKLKGGIVYSALTDFVWPGNADVVVSILHITSPEVRMGCAVQPVLNGVPVSSISFGLKDELDRSKPKKLYGNIGACVVGTNIGGIGFVLSKHEADEILADERYESVIKAFVSGDSINGLDDDESKRYAIAFGSMPLSSAERYPLALSIVRDRVKPQRDQAKNHGPGLHGKKYWWQHTLRADPLYEAIAGMSKCLARSLVSTSHCIKFMPANSLFNHSVVVFAYDDYCSFAVLQSSLHAEWASHYCSNLGKTVRYSVTEAFETFPFPAKWRENKDLAEAGEAYYCLRESICRRRGLGLTGLYGLVNNPDAKDADIIEMRAAIGDLDASAAASYGLDGLELKYEWNTPDSGEKDKGKRFQYRLDSTTRDSVLDALWSCNQARDGISPDSDVSTRSLKGKARKKSHD